MMNGERDENEKTTEMDWTVIYAPILHYYNREGM